MKPHIFVAVNQVNWEIPALVEPWKQIGRVTHFQNNTGFDQWDNNWNEVGKPAFNAALLKAVERAQEEQPIQLFFSYLSGRWLYPETLKHLKQINAPLVNISFDDTIHFRGFRDSGGWAGNVSIARYFDLCVTCQNPADVWKYKLSRARCAYMPLGAPDDFCALESVGQTENVVCFLGQNYGIRGEIVSNLSKKFPVRAYGKGWPSGAVSREKMGQIYINSLINLGFGYIGESPRQVGVKGRDFEVTAAGGFYLTSYHPVLASCFDEGKEIEMYRNKGELEEKISFYLSHPQKAIEIGKAAQERVRKEHRWSSRFVEILRLVSN